MKSNDMFALLERLKKHNDEHPLYQEVKQRVAPPAPFPRGIPVLEQGRYRKPSPMIRARMEYAGDWSEAFIGSKWLAVPAMEKAWASRKIKAQIQMRRTHWETSVLAKADPADLSLFSIDQLEYQEMYLRWGKREEPEIIWYTSGEEKKYKNLRTFVRALLRG